MTQDLDCLIQSLQACDPRISEALMNGYYSHIYRLSCSILSDPAEADDAAQETFIHAIRNLRHYQPGTNLKSWLSTIAVNICRDILRKRRAQQVLLSGLQTIIRLLKTSERTIEDTITHKHNCDNLWAAVRALDDKHRLPILLRFAHGLSVREIAQSMGLNEGTVHSRLHYAICKLKQRLGESGEDRWEEREDGGSAWNG